jgi:bromodomain-containing factor 1
VSSELVYLSINLITRTSKEGELNTENTAFDSSVSLAELAHAEESQLSPASANGAAVLTNGEDVDTDLLSAGNTPPIEFKRQLSASAPLSRLTLSADTNPTPISSATTEAVAVGSQADSSAETQPVGKETMDIDESVVAAPNAIEREHDHEMVDVPESSGKHVRAREDDDVDMEEPAAKKTRTGDDGSPPSDFKIPEVPPAEAPQNGAIANTASTSGANKTITKAQHKYLLVGLRNLKRIKDAGPFIEPVDPVKLNIPTYPTIIKNPMDISTMEKKLKGDEYATVEDYIADMDLIVSNAVTFNGPDHFVSNSARNLKKAFEKQLGHLPKADVVELSAAERKAKKWSTGNANNPALKATPIRRPSRTVTGQATSPTAGSTTSPFALGPNGVPTIRRDSTAGDGRPKREIHPPPSRDLPYSGAKPRKKKYLAELKFCDEVIKELLKPKHKHFAQVFHEPVDPVALNIPQYHKIIKKPMDLGTVNSKLKANEYEKASEFESDVRLIFANCYKFNPPKDAVHQMGKQLEQLFNSKWAELKTYTGRHAGVSGSRSPASSAEPEEEASEESEGEDVERVINEKIREITEQVEALKRIKTKGKAGKAGTAASGGNPSSGKKSSKKASAPAATAPPPMKKSKKQTKPKEPKAPYVTYEQKQEISDKINTLATTKMNQAYKIIRDNMPQLTVSLPI